MTNVPRRTVSIAVLVWVLLAPAPADAQACRPDCTHETKACVCAVEGRGVTVTAIGGMDRVPLLPGRALEAGDELASTDAAAMVAITCPRSSSLLLHGRFRSLIVPPADGQDCALSLLAGTADVQSNQPTAVSAGTTLMGSKRTTYRMQVSGEAMVACYVFEGEVDVRNLATGSVRSLETLKWASWRGGTLQQYGAPIDAQEISGAARVFARADLARARAAGLAQVPAGKIPPDLEARHAAVLSRPADTSARVALAAQQAQLGLARPALYQLNLAETLGPPPASDQAALVAATRWVAYKQLGQDTDAAREAEKLRTLDPKRFATIQQIETKASREMATTPTRPSTRPDIQVSVAVRPTAVAAGEPATVAVHVQSPDGKPIPGARVVLSANGGRFVASSEARTEGVTGADGAFRADWMCRLCAPTHRVEVEVGVAGAVMRSASAVISTR